MSFTQTSFNKHVPLSPRQALVCAALGAILWFVAAMLIKVLAPMGVFEGMSRGWLYIAIIPGTVPFIWMIAKLAGLARHQIGVGTAFATMTAVLLDGVALAWFPWLYADHIELIAGAGALILWGAGVGMVIGWALNRAE